MSDVTRSDIERIFGAIADLKDSLNNYKIDTIKEINDVQNKVNILGENIRETIQNNVRTEYDIKDINRKMENISEHEHRLKVIEAEIVKDHPVKHDDLEKRVKKHTKLYWMILGGIVVINAVIWALKLTKVI